MKKINTINLELAHDKWIHELTNKIIGDLAPENDAHTSIKDTKWTHASRWNNINWHTNLDSFETKKFVWSGSPLNI